MRVKIEDFRVLLLTIYSGVVTIGFSYLIGLATELDMLLVLALPLGLLLVGLFSWLPPRAQLLSWSAVTAWLLSAVYLGSSDLEYIMFFAVMLAAIACVFWSPWFLAAIWFIHPLWDLIPRELPDHQHDLPLACLIYDLVVAVYLAWRIRQGFFKDALVTPKNPVGLLITGAMRTLTAIGAVLVLTLQILAVGMVSMDPISTYIAIPIAAAFIAATLWIPLEGQKIFWLVFTIWTGMTFAHSGEALEIAIFGLMILLAVLGYRVSTNYWVIAWAFHALWHFLPRAHLSHETALLMGHWMLPLAGFLFEIAIAGYLVFLGLRLKKTNALANTQG